MRSRFIKIVNVYLQKSPPEYLQGRFQGLADGLGNAFYGIIRIPSGKEAAQAPPGPFSGKDAETDTDKKGLPGWTVPFFQVR